MHHLDVCTLYNFFFIVFLGVGFRVRSIVIKCKPQLKRNMFHEVKETRLGETRITEKKESPYCWNFMN